MSAPQPPPPPTEKVPAAQEGVVLKPAEGQKEGGGAVTPLPVDAAEALANGGPTMDFMEVNEGGDPDHSKDLTNVVAVKECIASCEAELDRNSHAVLAVGIKVQSEVEVRVLSDQTEEVQVLSEVKVSVLSDQTEEVQVLSEVKVRVLAGQMEDKDEKDIDIRDFSGEMSTDQITYLEHSVTSIKGVTGISSLYFFCVIGLTKEVQSNLVQVQVQSDIVIRGNSSDKVEKEGIVSYEAKLECNRPNDSNVYFCICRG